MKSIFQQIAQYLFLRKKDPSAPAGINTRMMHGMNRISILLFLVALVIMIIRLFRHH
ncbi:DUF6728 family protein [uncultured Chitinophaga sp.]|uniref:DUF6728 family protein n=1 Tax=uncultured Chitinophaga sp. TaxID=339340 RepID=UPI0025E0BEB2|nr:DUF6728 family protein [uncultured Chitinophaga sp.]